MKYKNFSEWVQDVQFYFPSLDMITNAKEYLVDSVAYWDRECKIGYIHVVDAMEVA